MFLLAVVVVLLVVDMTRRVRRVQADARVEARIAQQKIEEPQAEEQRADDETAVDAPEAENLRDSEDGADDAPEDDAPEGGDRPQG